MKLKNEITGKKEKIKKVLIMNTNSKTAPIRFLRGSPKKELLECNPGLCLL